MSRSSIGPSVLAGLHRRLSTLIGTSSDATSYDRSARHAAAEGEEAMRRRVEANRPWAKAMGYARAVRVGSVVEVSGTAAAAPDGTILSPGDVEGQTRAALATIGEALGELGASFRDVVRTRVLLADASRWEDAARAHGEIFGDVRPANTTVGGLEFIDPAILVEVEVSAVVEPG
jgi:enamine deaminase RidA (YjgF/YER057c/UK114 family)